MYENLIKEIEKLNSLNIKYYLIDRDIIESVCTTCDGNKYVIIPEKGKFNCPTCSCGYYENNNIEKKYTYRYYYETPGIKIKIHQSKEFYIDLCFFNYIDEETFSIRVNKPDPDLIDSTEKFKDFKTRWKYKWIDCIGYAVITSEELAKQIVDELNKQGDINE